VQDVDRIASAAGARSPVAFMARSPRWHEVAAGNPAVQEVSVAD